MFKTLSRYGEFEIRAYEKMMIAKISIPGNFQELNGMRELKKYLAGHNFRAHKFCQHGPFYQEYKSHAWELGVILPNGLCSQSVPKPIGNLIQVKELLPRKCGVLKFKGNSGPDLIINKAAQLKSWIWRQKLKITGPLIFLEHEMLHGISLFKQSEVIFDVD